MARARWLLLVALLAVPLAAASASGSFRVEGDAQLPSGTEASFIPLLLYHDDSTRVRGFDLQATRLVLHEFVETAVDVEVAGVSPVYAATSVEPEHTTTVLHEARITFGNASEPGYLGFYPDGDAWATFTAFSPATFRAQASGRAESHLGEGDEERPFESAGSYRRTLDAPHVWMEGAGRLLYEGSGLLKIVGPDLLVESREGSRTVATGEVRQNAAQADFHWVILELMPANLTIEGDAPWQMAGPDLRLRWEGESRFTPVWGSLTTWEGTYPAAGAPVVLSGRFSALVHPQVSDGRAEARMVLSGEMDRTSLRLQAAPLAQKVVDDPRFARTTVLLVGVAAGLGGSFAAGVWLTRRRRHAQAAEGLPFTVDDCMAGATDAAGDEDWPRAAEWLQRVRRLAPTSGRSAADLAHALFQMGQRDEALAMYVEASQLSEDGEADFNGAVIAIEAGRPPEEIERWLERALARSPAYVVDVESDPLFHPLRGRARFERLVLDAWSRVEDIDDGASVSRGP